MKIRIDALEKDKLSADRYIISTAPEVNKSEAVKECSTFIPKKEPCTVSAQVNTAPLFNENFIRNSKKLDNIIKNASALRDNYFYALNEVDENNIYFKTVDNCLRKLEKLSEKLASSEMEASNIVGELVKILNSTIVKNFVKKELFPFIDEFMLNCGFIKREIEVGKKLGDSDYDYIGEMPLDVPVDSPEQHNMVLAKEHDAYVIYYKDEDELSYRVIAGQYSIGKFSK